MKGNKGSERSARFAADAEWKAFEKLPPDIRDFCREELLFDYSSEQLLQVWNNCYGDRPTFKNFMRRSDQLNVRGK